MTNNLLKKVKETTAAQLIIETMANFLILGGIVYLFLWFFPVIKAEALYQYNRWRGVKYEVVASTQEADKQDVSDFLQKPQQPLKIAPVSTDFGIIIEKINVNAPVVANVDVTDKNAYLQALNQGVAHAMGTKFPGEKGNSFLFAHSTFNPLEIRKYNAVFTLLNKLEINDRVTMFYKGTRYDYFVREKHIVSPKDVQYLTAVYNAPTLTLQTCDPPGTDYKRLIVIATTDNKQ